VAQGQQPGLSLEAGEPLGIVRHGVGKHLDRHLAAEARVARAVHLAHATRAERGDDLVGSETGTGGEWHPGNLL
jgi:hypothetical protein